MTRRDGRNPVLRPELRVNDGTEHIGELKFAGRALGSAEGVVAGHHHGGEDQDGRDGDENGEGGPGYAVPAVEPDILGQTLELVRGAVLEPAKLEQFAHAVAEGPASRPSGAPVSLFSATPDRSATGGRTRWRVTLACESSWQMLIKG